MHYIYIFIWYIFRDHTIRDRDQPSSLYRYRILTFAFEHKPRHNRQPPKIHTHNMTAAEHFCWSSSLCNIRQSTPSIRSEWLPCYGRPKRTLVPLLFCLRIYLGRPWSGELIPSLTRHLPAIYTAYGFRQLPYHRRPTFCRTPSRTSKQNNPPPRNL